MAPVLYFGELIVLRYKGKDYLYSDFIALLIYLIHLLIVCGVQFIHYSFLWRSQDNLCSDDNLCKAVFSFDRVGPGSGTQVIRLGDKCYQLSRLAGTHCDLKLECRYF